MPENINFELTEPAAVTNKTPEIRDLEKIMKAEAFAAEAYRQVLKKFSTYEHANELRSILAEHEKAIEFWKTQLRAKAAPLEETTGPWSAVVETFGLVEKLNADSTTLKSLKEGEQHGLDEYEELLLNHNVNFQSISFIKNICLDQQRKHIAILDGLIGNS